MGFSHTFSVFELRWRRGAAAPGGSRHYCVPRGPVCYGEPARGARAGLLRAHQPHGTLRPRWQARNRIFVNLPLRSRLDRERAALNHESGYF